MQHVLETLISKKMKNRFVWQVVRIVKNSRTVIAQSGKDVSWASKHGAVRGFKAQRRILWMMPY